MTECREKQEILYENSNLKLKKKTYIKLVTKFRCIQMIKKLAVQKVFNLNRRKFRIFTTLTNPQ